MKYKAVILDVDGVITPFRSAWQRLHNVLGTDGELNKLLYKLGVIDYYEWALYDVLLWHGAPRRFIEAYFQTTKGLDTLVKYFITLASIQSLSLRGWGTLES